MSFANVTNPYRNPAAVPEEYRKHPSLSKLFKADGTYVRPAEDPVTLWAIALLHQEYGVPLDVMALEDPALFAQAIGSWQRDYQGRVDLVIHDDRYPIDSPEFIMLEAMEPGKKFRGEIQKGGMIILIA